ncbi:MAG: hypothetical protein CMG64_01795 [Candidatus Marinimicrobia bacterium]|nr:hypothetical protein [Candidatus Neomarinimicrobiota bacterium]|tara:strand:+ start:3909 stop:4973 length:1065 start_codon:yes stop_codon:yes gene_type:complete
MRSIIVFTLILSIYFLFPKIKEFFIAHPIHKEIVSKIDILFLFRPTMFFAVWPLISIGMYLSYLNSIEYPQFIFSYDTRTFIFFISNTFIIGSTFIKNQITDIETDRINKKLFLLDGYLDLDVVEKVYKISLLIGFILLLFSNVYNLIISLLIFVFWDFLYNDKPCEWKKNPFLGPFCNLVVCLLLLLSGWTFIASGGAYFFAFNKVINFTFFVKIIPYLLIYLAVVLITDIPDIKGDKDSQKDTFTLEIGKRNTMLISFILVVASFFISLYLVDPLACVSIICSIPFFFYGLFRGLNKDILRSIRYPIFILNFFVTTIFPYLFLVIVLIYYLSKYYYWHRFDLNYPTLLVEND